MHKPVWISHRGVSHAIDENTRDAFDLAIRSGFSHLETDLRVSADGHIVLCHDRSLARVADRVGFVDEMQRAELETVILRQGGHLMFFDEFIDRYAAYNWTFDIKAETGSAVVSALRNWLREHDAASWIVAQGRFLFWRREQEEDLLRHLPGARCYARENECWRAGLAVILGLPICGGIRAGRTYAIPPSLGGISLFRSRYVQAFHRFGASVLAFLPRSDEEARDALLAGFDEVLTNGVVIK